MKRESIILLVCLFLAGVNLFAQRERASYSDKYGNTLNLGLGIGGYSGYYGYVNRSLPVFHLNYEFDIARNFTLAPFATLYTYHDTNYRETVIPIGAKGTLYLDKLLNANSNWDFYVAGSLGFALVSTSWDNDYNGDRAYYHTADPLFIDFHVGTEYHLTRKLGIFLDLSSGVSTIGLAFH